jgi:hypothetical protein
MEMESPLEMNLWVLVARIIEITGCVDWDYFVGVLGKVAVATSAQDVICHFDHGMLRTSYNPHMCMGGVQVLA